MRYVIVRLGQPTIVRNTRLRLEEERPWERGCMWVSTRCLKSDISPDLIDLICLSHLLFPRHRTSFIPLSQVQSRCQSSRYPCPEELGNAYNY